MMAKGCGYSLPLTGQRVSVGPLLSSSGPAGMRRGPFCLGRPFDPQSDTWATGGTDVTVALPTGTGAITR